MKAVLSADIGSTFTKLAAIDLENRRIIGAAKAFTTIETNVMEGFNAALIELLALCGPLSFEQKLATSSAAGGLKMVAIGLVPDLTAAAARMAAAGAGAKILKTFSYELTGDEIAEIQTLAPDIILLSGGTDGGNRDTIIHNARLLAASPIRAAIVAAGNKGAKDELKRAFAPYPGEVIFCPNVMPEMNSLNIEPARCAIRDLFIKNIISAKGLDELEATLDLSIIPTPLAVFEAGRLLSLGFGDDPGLGELLVFDVGGATTDVCSMAEGLPGRANVFMHGFKRPFAERTVEGDLGLRYSLKPLSEAFGLEKLAALADASESEARKWLAACAQNPEIIAEPKSREKRLDEAAARAAVELSMRRHAGFLETVFTGSGQAFAQTGKDLSGVRWLVGTGGPIINADSPEYILGGAIYAPSDMNLLKPLAPEILIDKKYILSAMGSLLRLSPEKALAIMKGEIFHDSKK